MHWYAVIRRRLPAGFRPSLIDALVQDCLHAGRSLRRSPGFTLVAVLTLALGLGASAAIFSVAYGILWRPLQYADADRLVVLQTLDRIEKRPIGSGFSASDQADWSRHARSYRRLAVAARTLFALDTETGNESVVGASVSPGFFDLLGVRPQRGRGLAAGAVPEVVISDRLWRTRFGAAADVVGQGVRLNGAAYTIVGVAPAGFRYPVSLSDITVRADLWAPVGLDPVENEPWARHFHLLARLAPGVTVASAQLEAETVASGVAAEQSDAEPVLPLVSALPDLLRAEARRPLLLFLAAFGLVLLVAYANVTGLLLARRLTRRDELAVRLALGAPRWRVVTHALAEAGWLAGTGALLGLVLARWAVAAVEVAQVVRTPFHDGVNFDGPVLAFTLVSAGLVATAIGLVSAAPLVSHVTGGRDRRGVPRVHGARTSRRLGSGLVGAQVAVAVMLLVGASLLGQSFLRLVTTDFGARADRVLTVELNLAMGRELTDEQRTSLGLRVVEAVAELPGVESVGAANGLPPNRFRMMAQVQLQDPAGGEPRRESLHMLNPTPDYLATLDVPLRAGRWFSETDTGEVPVAILSAGAAQQIFGTTDVVGREMPLRNPARIVGVVDDVKFSGLTSPAVKTLYVPFAQYPFKNLSLVVRTAGDPAALLPSLRRTIHGLDREIMLGAAQPLPEIVAEAVARPRFQTAALVALALAALALTACGLSGVVAYAVAQRTGEIAVRVALGANGGAVVRMVMRQGLAVAVAGLVLGLFGALVLSRFLDTLLFEVSPTNPLAFMLSALGVLLVALLASYLPARRAAAVDPLVALRAD